MTGSRYHSQQSEILINVSENHSSTTSSPHAMPREQTQVEKSPTVRASQSQAIVPEAIERIANSQQESVPTQALSQPIHQDDTDADDEELYAVSPRAKAKLDAVVSARKSSQAGKPALPARNPIDALLSEGAVVAPSAAKARVDDNEQVIGDSVEEPPSDYATLDTKLKAIDAEHASTTKVTSKRQPQEANAQRKKPNRDNPEDDEEPLEKAKSQAAPQRPDPSTSTKESSKTLPATQTNAKPGTKRAVAEPSKKNRDSGEMVARKSALSNGGNENHIAASELKDATAKGKAAAVSSLAKEKRQKKPGAAAARGRPQRQAKQSALEKLKAKNGMTAGSSDGETSDDSGDDSSDNFSQPKATKDTSKRAGNTKQLPTPLTLGNMAKQSEGESAKGKLKSVKPKPTVTTARPKAPTTNVRTLNVAASAQKYKTKPAPTGHKEDHVSDESKSKPHRLASYHPSQDPPSTDKNEQPKSAKEPQPQRPGALKRPARSFSRGRKPQRDSMYELKDESLPTKKRGRSVSKASKASTVKASTAKASTTHVSTTKAGPTRQKMQSESVKERLEPVINSSRHRSVSVQPQDKAPNRIPQRQDVSSAERKERYGRSMGKDASRQHKDVPRASKHVDDQSSDKAQASAAAKRHQLGSSQANAIFIEQDDASSSSPPPSPPKVTNAQTHTAAHAGPRQNVTRPQTPAPMPSSPPAYGRGSTHKLAKDKPTIIAFSKQGPRNQGVGSARKIPGSGLSSRTTFFDMVNEEDSSSMRGRATERADAPAAPKARKPATIATSAGNVSRDGEDVFDDFIKNGKNAALANMLKQPQSEENRLDQPSEDDGFVAIDNFDGTTLVGDDAPPDAAAKEPTASQIAMPPPKAAIKTAATQTTKSMMPRPSKSKSVIANAGTRVASDTPRPIQTKPAASSAKPSEVVNVKKVAGKLRRSSNPRLVPSQRVSQKLPAGDLLPTKATSSEVATTGQPKRKRVSNEQQADRSPKKAKIVQLKSPQGVAQPNPTRSRKSSTVPEASIQHGDPVKRTDRRNRASRRSTQGSQSQGVDITGSPYPVHLDVPTQATALETFSQQSGLSSDQMSRSDAEVARKLDLTAVPRLQAIIKPASVSSNGKPVPAAPNERSRAVTRVASGPLAQQLLDARHEQSASSDPFTSSRGRETTESTAVADTGYKQAVRDHNITMDRRVSGAKRKHQEYTEGNDDDGDDDVDPDKTLVEPIADPDIEWQRIPSSPAADSTSSASTSNTASKALEDVGDWRNTLKPHQSHLFDALVIAAHKLVRHMVDHETAEQDAEADYRRRGEIIVTELQRAHAREYHRYSQEMLGWKKRAADELAESGRKLKQSMRNAERARSERRKAGEKRDEFTDMLEEMVAELE